MTIVNCAISGVRFTCQGLDFLNLPYTEGYYHPVFAAPFNSLYKAYSKHCKGELTSTDSYLVFLAFLHSSEKIIWKHPATLNPTSSTASKLIENNIRQLLAVLEKTNLIVHPSFSQPEFSVTYENSDLTQIPNWIKAWEANIEYFYSDKADVKMYEDLQKTENKLSVMILSGDSPEQYAGVIAIWADKAASFPPHKSEEWKKVIRSCFNMEKMFHTPLALIKEISEYCACNIEAGSIHFHSLARVLRAGVTNHIDYLGGAYKISDYTLLPSITGNDYEENDLVSTKLQAIAAKAPSSSPIESEYSSKVEYIRAKLAYRVAATASSSTASSSKIGVI